MSVDHLWIGNLPYGTSEEDIHRLTASIGALETVEVHKDQKTGRSMGWAFCRYQNQETTLLAKELLDGVEFGGRIISVEWAASRMSNQQQQQQQPTVITIDQNTDRLQLQRDIATMTLPQLKELISNIEITLRTYTDSLSDTVTGTETQSINQPAAANPEAWASFLKTRQLLLSDNLHQNNPE